ncbi:hypothetical protein BGX34_010978 [Mortierella sp. NVP85]|nr:hypothetical protein BGX34_010978 [Mortierella sp. NVP85]
MGITHSTSEGTGEDTDELIVPPENSSNYRHIAGVILRGTVESFGKREEQRVIRNFVNSCLLNLSDHNGMDTSGVFDLLTSEAGCACLGRILTRPMSVDAGNDGTELSFQYVVLPLVGVLTRKSVCQSVKTSAASRLYSTVYNHRKAFLDDGVLRCMDQLIKRGSIQDKSIHGARMAVDTSLCHVLSFQQAFLTISRLLYQLIKRIEDAKFELENSICGLSDQRKVCILMLGADSAGNVLGNTLEKEIGRLVTIVTDARTLIIENGLDNSQKQRSGKRGPNIAYLNSQYDPPGHQSPNDPRHDNDHSSISSISILPTLQELTCTRAPFLPSNCIPEAPHFLPFGWERQMDIQFRLYREDLMNPLRNGLMAFSNALAKTTKGKEDDLLKRKVYDGVNVDVYGNVRFSPVDCDMQGKSYASVKFAQPYQLRNRRHGKRREFWEQSKSRLMQGALVFMVRRLNSNQVDQSSVPSVVLGVVADRNTYELSSNWEDASIRISLVDPRLYMAMFNATNIRESDDKSKQWFLVEPSGGFFESYRPVLEVLQTRLPSTMPFGKYMAPTKEETVAMLSAGVKIDPPKYARAPGFRFDLSILTGQQGLKLDVTNPTSAKEILNALRTKPKLLDETQSVALIDALCREVSLINGPPGTGKTTIGVQLMRVLVHNMPSMGNGPILCICYTNHALDQFLEHLLEEGIKNIIRVGSRSNSEEVKKHTLQGSFRAYKRPRRIKKRIAELNKQWRAYSERIKELQNGLQSGDLSWMQVERYLSVNHPGLREQFIEPALSDPDVTDDFTTVSHGQRKRSPFQQWLEGDDIEEHKRWNEEMLEVKDTTSLEHCANPFELLDNENDKLEEADLEQFKYEIPSTDRPLEELLVGDIWEMSMTERRRLMDSWRPRILEPITNELTKALEGAKAAIEEKNVYFKEIRRQILSQTLVIGMTTSGAAKHHELISAVAPKIIICEEAGEVVESHILATLSSSTQHLIMIGDHLQLRPQIQTYSLSSESESGRNHKLDISLFERLVTKEMNAFPLPLSCLTIQRRMRPEISSLIRNSLYPHLEDGENVKEYPDVKGMSSNLYFMNHLHPVDGKDQFSQQSFSNSFEVEMIKALVYYLIMNGYKPGDIAVLTPYLGQLSKLRASLGSSFVLVMDEKEQEQLDIQDAEKDLGSRTDKGAGTVPETVNVSLDGGLTLRTIDNFQGEQAEIVIISLVRSDVKEDGSAASSSIGFLKSENRTNVLLSRAKHGMFLIGNAHLMEKRSNGIWPQVVAELRESDRVGEGFPIACKNHPEIRNIVDTPEMFRKISPNGGCYREGALYFDVVLV